MSKILKYPYIHLSKNAFGSFCFILLSLFLASCNKDNVSVKPEQMRYYPLEEGLWREYMVDSVVWRGSTLYANDTLHFFIREEIDSTFTDNTGETNYIVKTLYRENNTDNWTIRYVTAAKVNEQRAELVYNNDRYVKLIFPVINGQGWNANAYNDEDPDNFRKSVYSNAHQPQTINGKNLDSTVTVTVQDHDDFVKMEHETEQYAAGVGLVKHYWEDIAIGVDPDDPNHEKKVWDGWQYTKTLIDYGKK